MHFFSLLFFALALNADALGVGISYGMRRIRVPLVSMLIISIVSMTIISISMFMGQMAVGYIPPETARHVGGVILVAIGVWAIYQYYRQKKYITHKTSPVAENNQLEPVSLLRIQVLGLIIQVLKKPHLADLDLSGTISGREAILLGISLSVDSLGAGIAISFLGYSIISTALCTGICQVLFTYLGLLAGRGLIRIFQARQIAALPGVILIMLGITKLY